MKASSQPQRKVRRRVTSPQRAVLTWSRAVSADMDEKWNDKLKARTGLDLAQWCKRAIKDGPKERPRRRAWLMQENGLSRMESWWVDATTERGGQEWNPERSIAGQYGGAKAHLRPIMEAVVARALKLGDDVRACPCETMIPLYREFVFAEIRAATNSRLDLGLALGEHPEMGRLESLRGRAAGNRITHRITLTNLRDIDADVMTYLKAAYTLGNQKRSRTATASKAPPQELVAALKKSRKAWELWSTLTPSCQIEWIEWVTGAVKSETRASRVDRMVERLDAGHKRMY